jgi:hypothetical protein
VASCPFVVEPPDAGNVAQRGPTFERLALGGVARVGVARVDVRQNAMCPDHGRPMLRAR